LIVSHGSPISACHLWLTGEFKYVGQCTISKYLVYDAPQLFTHDPNSINILVKDDGLDQVDIKSRGNEDSQRVPEMEKVLVSLENSSTEMDSPMEEKPPSRSVQRRRSSIIRMTREMKDTRQHSFKCLLIGDSSHLSDRRNLRDVIRIDCRKSC
jgi:hypothetical protein